MYVHIYIHVEILHIQYQWWTDKAMWAILILICIIGYTSVRVRRLIIKHSVMFMESSLFCIINILFMYMYDICIGLHIYFLCILFVCMIYVYAYIIGPTIDMYYYWYILSSHEFPNSRRKKFTHFSIFHKSR